MRRRAFVIVAVLAVLAATLVATSISTAAPSGTQVADLFAGKTTDVGDVFVWNDATNLYVQIDVTGGWCMTESHVAAASTLAGIPQNSQGNPPPGQFPYGDTYSPCATTDTFTIPLAELGTNPVIAVHAKVLHETAMWVFSDGGNTTVTGSLVGPLPRPAVDAWEAFGDPLDPTPSTWDIGVGTGTFAFADWIWSNYRVNTPTVNETVTFVRAFTVPGPVAPGSWMKVTSDDAYTANLNGTPVASDVWPNWPSVETASPFAPASGPNTLLFGATNSNLSWGQTGTIDNNPGGLIYEARINYYDRSESAWAGTSAGQTPFLGKNWATYFTFNPSLETAPIYNVTTTPTAWTCVAGASVGSLVPNSTVTWWMVGPTVYAKVVVDNVLPNSTFDIWVEQNGPTQANGTCPPGTNTPSNPAALTTNANGDGTVTFSFTPIAGAQKFFLSMWTPSGSLTGTQVLRTTAVTLP